MHADQMQLSKNVKYMQSEGFCIQLMKFGMFVINMYNTAKVIPAIIVGLIVEQ